jgi:hypothetical protein
MFRAATYVLAIAPGSFGKIGIRPTVISILSFFSPSSRPILTHAFTTAPRSCTLCPVSKSFKSMAPSVLQSFSAILQALDSTEAHVRTSLQPRSLPQVTLLWNPAPWAGPSLTEDHPTFIQDTLASEVSKTLWARENENASVYDSVSLPKAAACLHLGGTSTCPGTETLSSSKTSSFCFLTSKTSPCTSLLATHSSCTCGPMTLWLRR